MPIWDDSEVAHAGNAVDACRAVDAACWQDAICSAVARGWLLSVGGSRDGYSVSLGVIVDGKSERKYHVTATTLEDALIRVVKAASATDGPAPRKGKSGRQNAS